ncbi:MAG TPA: hypothetical protein PLQ35_00505 [bacterium]|nr:hypothetical protein [bacterium]HQL60750.1 hypothetical protein [bacterium]
MKMDPKDRGAFLTRRLTEYQQLWSKFMEYFNIGVNKEANGITDDEENTFLELQAELMRRTQFLKFRMPKGVFDIENDVKKLFSQCISLRTIHSEPGIKVHELRSQWHEVSISLNKMFGQLRAALENELTGGRKKKKRRWWRF